MTEIEWWDYDDADEMADAVAGDISFVIESAIDARGAAVIALAGGKTPIADLREARRRPSSTGSASRSSRATSGSCRWAIRCRT